MTLTEFLLARIGEDEAVATRIVVRRPLACPVCSQTVEEFITPAVINGYRPDRPDRCEPCGHELTEDQSADCLTILRGRDFWRAFADYWSGDAIAARMDAWVERVKRRRDDA